MAPCRALDRRKLERGQRERRRIHAELRIDERVERIIAYQRRKIRGTPARAVAEFIGALGETSRQPIGTRMKVIDEHFEAIARQIGDPRFEVATHRGIAKERRCEADPHARCASHPTNRRLDPLRRPRSNDGVRNSPVVALQRAVVLTLVREQEIGPPKLIDGALGRQLRRSTRKLGLQRLESIAKTRPRSLEPRQQPLRLRQRLVCAHAAPPLMRTSALKPLPLSGSAPGCR